MQIKNKIVIFSDFDGTITTEDSLDVLFSLFANPKIVSKYANLWESEQIGSDECLQTIFDTVNLTPKKFETFLDSIGIDPGFELFCKFVQLNNIEFRIVSDGTDNIIGPKIEKQKDSISGVHCNSGVVFNNKFIFTAATSAGLICVHKKLKCANCKTQIILKYKSNNPNTTSIYIGDGRSDFFAASQCDLVFAKKSLAKYCKENNINFIKYDDFTDITNYFEDMYATK